MANDNKNNNLKTDSVANKPEGIEKVELKASVYEYVAPLKDKKITWKEIKRQKALIIIGFVLMVYGIVFYYLPLIGWATAFVQYKPADGIFGSKFIGFDKFKFLFTNETIGFWPVMRNTFCMGLINLVTTTIMAILFAILLNEIKSTLLKKSIQTVSYLPHFLSWIVVVGILHDALSASGIVNELLIKWGVIDTYINFVGEKNMFWGLVAFANCWKETGWNAIIYLAAITAIDPCLYEAASIDGAGRWAKIRYITLPGIKPTFMILLLINVGNVLNAGFEVQYLLGNDLVIDVSQTIDIFVLKWGISVNDFSLGTAAGIFKSAISILLIVVANAVAKKAGEERLF